MYWCVGEEKFYPYIVILMRNTLLYGLEILASIRQYVLTGHGKVFHPNPLSSVGVFQMQGAGDWVFFVFLLLNSVGLLFGGLVLSFSVWFSVDRDRVANN